MTRKQSLLATVAIAQLTQADVHLRVAMIAASEAGIVLATNDIILKTDSIPVIPYEYNGNLHNFFPDCYLRSTNTIVETKSNWTWDKYISQNMAKISSTINRGYNMRIIVWNKKKELLKNELYLAKIPT